MKEEENTVENEEIIEDATTEDDSDTQESRVYEVGFLLDGGLLEDSLMLEVQKIKDVLEQREFIFVSEGIPTKIDLEYTMTVSRDGSKNSYDTAYFGWVKYHKSPSDISMVYDALEKNNNIVRFMIIKALAEDLVPFHSLLKKDFDKTEKKPPMSKDSTEPISISKEELDKTIEKLVIE